MRNNKKDVEIKTDIEMGGKVLRLGIFDEYFKEACTKYFESGAYPDIIVAIHDIVRHYLTKAIHDHDDKSIVFPWGAYTAERTNPGLFVRFTVDHDVTSAIEAFKMGGYNCGRKEAGCILEHDHAIVPRVSTIFRKTISRYLSRSDADESALVYCSGQYSAHEVRWLLNSYAYAYAMSIIDTIGKYDMAAHTGCDDIVIYGNYGKHAIVKLDGDQIIDLI